MKTQWFQYGPDKEGTSNDNADDTPASSDSDTAVTGNGSSDGSSAATDDGNTASENNDGSAGSDPSDVNNSSAAGSDGSTDFLFADVSPYEANPNWQVLVDTPNFLGGILWASQGTKQFHFNEGGWFKRNWASVKEVAGDRYGSTWFRGAYVFLNFSQDGAEQADYYLQVIEEAGGWDKGDILPIVDVELGQDGKDGKHKRNPNQDASAQQIIDCTTACADRLREVTGRNIMLYGRGAMRDKFINNKMGCDIVWNPSYTPSIILHGLEAWTLDDVALWQYCGDGQAALRDQKRFPRVIPGFGNTDISVYVEGANKPSLESLIKRLGIGDVSA